MAESNPTFAEVVRRKLNIHLIADADADEILAHFARNVGENFMFVRQGHAKHRSWQDLGDRANNLNWLFLFHATNSAIMGQSLIKSRSRRAVKAGPGKRATAIENSASLATDRCSQEFRRGNSR